MSVYCAVHAVYVYLQLMQTVRFSSVLVRLGFAWVQCFQDMLWSEEIFEARGGVVVFGPDIFAVVAAPILWPKPQDQLTGTTATGLASGRSGQPVCCLFLWCLHLQ